MQSTLAQRRELPALCSYITSLQMQAGDVSFLVNVLENTFERPWHEAKVSQIAC